MTMICYTLLQLCYSFCYSLKDVQLQQFQDIQHFATFTTLFLNLLEHFFESRECEKIFLNETECEKTVATVATVAVRCVARSALDRKHLQVLIHAVQKDQS